MGRRAESGSCSLVERCTWTDINIIGGQNVSRGALWKTRLQRLILAQITVIMGLFNVVAGRKNNVVALLKAARAAIP